MRGRGLLAGVLLVLLLAVAAAGGILYYLQSQKPAPDPLAVYRPAMHAGFTIEPERLQAMPQYSITLRLDPATLAYTGTSEVSFIVASGLPQDEIFFRLYPNLPQFNGVMHVSSAQVNGASMSFAYEAANTAVRVPVPPLQAGTRATARLTFTGEAPKHRADYYTIFGQSEDILSLTNFYPILARYRSDGWATDVADPQGDVGFHDAALYRVTTIMPPGQVVVATGSVVTQTVLPDKQLRTEYVQGPAREFTLIMSPRFQVEEMDAYGTLVRSYYIPEQAMAGRSALYTAVASLQVYSDVFGPYPYREMAVVQAPLTFHGMEFPGINLIGTDAYSKHLQDLEILVAHEVAHQWWYNQVGSDQNRTPWLDEGLAEFSMFYYQAMRYGEDFAHLLRRQRWTAPVQFNRERGLDAPIGRPVTAYKGNYETVVYAKGALFFANLRDALGAETFDRLLRTYLERYKWQVATPAEFRALAEEVSGRSLEEVWKVWVEG